MPPVSIVLLQTFAGHGCGDKDGYDHAPRAGRVLETEPRLGRLSIGGRSGAYEQPDPSAPEHQYVTHIEINRSDLVRTQCSIEVWKKQRLVHRGDFLKKTCAD